MGSNVSRDTSSGIDQRTVSATAAASDVNGNGNNNNSDDRELSRRPTKRRRTSSSEEQFTTAIESPTTMRHPINRNNRSSTNDLEALQNDLEEVERGLNERRGMLFEGGSADRSGRTPSSSRGGRALFESIGSALGNIRGRLRELTRGRRRHDENYTSTEAGSSVSSSSSAATAESIRVLSQRLDTAELSHSTRMPLNLLQSELSRTEDDTGPNASQAAAAAEDETNASRRRQLRRQSSTLSASRDRDRDDISDSASVESESSALSANSNNRPDVSFASGRSLAAAVRMVETTMPTLAERPEDETEVSIEEEDAPNENDNYSGRGLLLPDSARKHKHKRPSMRKSLRILGSDVVRRLTKHGTDEEEKTGDESNTTIGALDGGTSLPSATPILSIYTWGSLKYSESSCLGDNTNNSDGDGHKEGATKADTTYQLFGTSDDARAAPSPRCLPPDTRLGRADVVSMSATETHCAFVTSTGRLLACGNNTEGAVDPSLRGSLQIPRPTTLDVGLAMHRIKKVSCGINHTAVVTETKSVLSWGCNAKGQLGHRKAKRNGAASFNSPKVFVLGGGRRADNVVCCDGYTLVLTTRMEAFVCGGESTAPPDRRLPYIIGDDDFFPIPKQKSVLRGLPLVGIASGAKHMVVWTAHGTAYAWGCNESGQCGREYPRELKIPVPIKVPISTQAPLTDASSGNSPKSFPEFLVNWNVWANGEPISLASDVHVVDVACGKNHTVLVTDSGRLLVCGSNTDGQLGAVAATNPGDSPSVSSRVQPVAHPDPQGKFQIAQAGSSHTIVLDDAGSLWQMGKGEPSMRKVSSLPDDFKISSIMAGGSINFAVCKSRSSDTPCSAMPSPPELDELMKAIRSEHEQKKDTDAQSSSSSSEEVENTKSYLSSVEDLARGTENLFKSPAVMNSLFVDPEEIDHMYHTLIHGSHNREMKQKMISSIERAMKTGLKSMVDSRLIYFESVRFLLLYLQCPLWRDEEQNAINENEDKDEESKITFDARGNLLFLLCETILGLPFEGYKAFLAWSDTVYGEKLFVPFLVKPLVQQLNYRFKNNITHGIPLIAGVLRWLHTVNERSDGSLAKGEDFYSSGIDDMSMEALFEDLTTYHMATDAQRSSNFFLAGHPFLMTPMVKQKLLQVEHQMSMVDAAQREGVSFDTRTREYKFQPYFVLAIDRKYLLQQTLQAVAKASTGELRKGLKVVFKGEDGVDAGGVTKEFFQLLCEKLFDVNTGMWSTSFGNNNETWFNSDCTWNDEGYYLVGVLCGLAVYNSVILDVHFPHAIYRKLLGLPLGSEDLIDEDVRKGLKSLLDYDGDIDAEHVFCLDFEVAWTHLGQERKKELKPGGSSIAVTSENKEEYVRLYVKWLLVDSIKAQYDEFERGFNQVMEDSSLDILLTEELELLVTGTPELDFSALEEPTEYEGGYDKDSAVVKSIWKWIKSASLPTQEKFLRFCTGSSKGPIGGLGKMPFKIQRAGPDSQQLPTAHTCFNTLIIPDYGDDYDKLSDRLGRAVIECEGFGLQ